MKNKKLLLSILILIIGIFVLSIFAKPKDVLVTKRVNTDIVSTGVALNTEAKVDITEYRKEYNNEEIKGVLKIPYTDLEAVITQSDDNTKYLTKDAYGNKNTIGNPFLDYRVDINLSPKLLIYGHNSKKNDPPFKTLENYYDKDYYLNHQYIELYTDEHLWKYKIFSVYVETRDWDYMTVKFKDSKDWLKHLKKLKSKSLYDTDTELKEDDKILILQTCSHKKDFANYDKKYLLVVARRLS